MGFGPVEGGGGGGGGGAVDSVNGQTGVVVLTKANIGLANVNNTSDANKPVSTAQATADSDVQAFSIQRGNHTGTQAVDTVTGNNNALAGFDSSGEGQSIPGYTVDTGTGGMSALVTVQPNNVPGFPNFQQTRLLVDPLQNSPDTGWTVQFNEINVDPNNSGFDFGTNGGGPRVLVNNVFHEGTSDIGAVELIQNNFQLGNGTDPIDVRGFGYILGFGQVDNNVNISGPMQGYGYQPNIAAGATIDPTVYTTAFYDSANINTPSPTHTSANFSPSLVEIVNNGNYSGIQMSPQVDLFSGNAGFTGIGMFPNLGDFSGGGFQGITINPTINLASNYATGLQVDMSNVTASPGVTASLVVQDITYTMIQPGTAGNSISVEYLNTTTAGNEVASLVSSSQIQVTIESGVSTATQVLAALNANVTLVANINFVITGTAGNAQVTYAQTNLSGGVNPAQVTAAQFTGDVSINGALSFTGGLSIGSLQSFAPYDLATLPGGVAAIDTLITQPTLAASATKSGSDLLAINTAMLLTLGDNATVTSNFLGYAALGLPAVVSLGTGATIDRVSGAVFAISLDASAAGGTADIVDLCRAIAIPNGTTTVNKLVGYKMDMPFGDVGTTSWGLYVTPTAHNYMAGDLLVGGTAGSDDTVTNSSVALEIKSTTKAFVLSRMDTTERNALTAVAGMVIFNTTTSAMEVYDGGAWV
jgi:hypothetical protein